MSCPFKHLWTTPPEDGPADVSLLTETNRAPSQTHSEPSDNKNNQGFSAPVSRQGPVCPLGFGSSRGPSLSALHCPLCRSLYHDPVLSQPCEHRFCRYCIQKFKDCPLCGADIDSVTGDGETQRAINTFLDVHAADSVVELSSGITGSTKNSDDSDGKRKAVNNLLNIGLSSLMGGNPEGGIAYLSRCRALIETHRDKSLLASDGYESDEIQKTDILLKLGAVYDCLGDCYRAMGDLASALEHYGKAALQLQTAQQRQSSKSDTLHALSVILNKQGEVMHQQGDIEGALGLYERALEARRDRLRQGDGIECSKEAGFDVVVSELKVADAYRSLGNKEEALRHASFARALLTKIEQSLPPPLAMKKEVVKEYLASFSE